MNGQQVYTFDANGNLLESDTMTNTWDAANRLTHSTNSTNSTNSLTPIYNGVNDRVGQVTDGVTTTFALDGQGLPEVIYTSEGNAYLHLPGVIMAESSAGETRYLLADGLGSVRQATDDTGLVVAYNEFDPYGNPVQDGSEPYGYTGEWWESEIGLLHLRARWYLPYLNQFLSPDPIIPDYTNPQSLNQYAYAYNNPVNLVDPSGLCPPSIPGCRDDEGRPIDQFYRYGDRGDSVSLFGPNPWYPTDGFVRPPSPQEMRAYRLKVIKSYGERCIDLSESETEPITHLEAMAKITTRAAQLYGPDETYRYVQDLGDIFVGFSGPMSPIYAACNCGPRSEHTIYRGPGHPDGRLEDTGFVDLFTDGSSQPRHFWFAVQIEIIFPTDVVEFQAFAHEDPNFPILGAGDGSDEDVILSLIASQLGQGLDNGTIHPSEVGDWLRENLGEEYVVDYKLKNPPWWYGD